MSILLLSSMLEDGVISYSFVDSLSDMFPVMSMCPDVIDHYINVRMLNILYENGGGAV